VSVPSVSRSHISYVACVPISSLMVIVLPEMIEAAWARALPGREAAVPCKTGEILLLQHSRHHLDSDNARSSRRGNDSPRSTARKPAASGLLRNRGAVA
jgi:hypothetical protein